MRHAPACWNFRLQVSKQLAEQGAGGDEGGLMAGEGIRGHKIAINDELERVRGLELLLEVGESRVEIAVGLFHFDESDVRSWSFPPVWDRSETSSGGIRADAGRPSNRRAGEERIA